MHTIKEDITTAIRLSEMYTDYPDGVPIPDGYSFVDFRCPKDGELFIPVHSAYVGQVWENNTVPYGAPRVIVKKKMPTKVVVDVTVDFAPNIPAATKTSLVKYIQTLVDESPENTELVFISRYVLSAGVCVGFPVVVRPVFAEQKSLAELQREE